jgi:hypothetical protein
MTIAAAPAHSGYMKKVLDMANWIQGAVGRKVTIAATSSTVDTATYYESDGTTVAFTMVTTYNNSGHDAIVSVERTV